MLRTVEADELGPGGEDEFADAAIIHHTIPTTVVVVEKQPERHRQRASVADDDDPFARMACRDRTKGRHEPVGDLLRRFAAVRAIVGIGSHVVEEFLVVEEGLEGHPLPFAEIVFGQIGIDLGYQSKTSGNRLRRVMGAIEWTCVDRGDRFVVRFDEGSGRFGLAMSVVRERGIR